MPLDGEDLDRLNFVEVFIYTQDFKLLIFYLTLKLLLNYQHKVQLR